jgi:D-alanyl-D-alanine carboxypeptidase
MTDDVPSLYRGRAPRLKNADHLESVGLDVRGREALLNPGAAAAWIRMVGAASSCGVTLLIVSAYRSIERQREIVSRKREKGLTWDEILRVGICAEPMTSYLNS